MSKIYQNISNNPSQTQKYGDLHYEKINKKLSKCKPAMELLFLSGFEKSNNNKRLIWRNTQNNMTILKHIHNKLISISDNGNTSVIAQQPAVESAPTQVLHGAFNSSLINARSQINNSTIIVTW